MADKYLSAAGKRRKVYINTFEAFDELMADICRQKTSSYYSCHSKEDGKPIGSIGLHRNDLAEKDDEYELGYWIGKPFWGQGLIPEASREMLRHAFEDLGMARIWCGHYDGNIKSRRVQEKLGFVYHHTTEGIEVSLLGETRTGHVMLLTREDWKKGIENE